MSKALYIAYIGGHTRNKPSYECWEFLLDEPLTEEEASSLAWDVQCDEASGRDVETYECEDCGGEGCNTCGGEGYVDAYGWCDHVEQVTSCWIEKYDPEIHYAVESERTEHLVYKAVTEMNNSYAQVNRFSAEVAKLKAQLELAETHLKKSRARHDAAIKVAIKLDKTIDNPEKQCVNMRY